MSQQTNQLVAVLTQLLTAAGAEAPIVIADDSAEIKAARLERRKTIVAYARNVALAQREQLFDLFDFDTGVVMQNISGQAYRHQQQYFFARDKSDMHAKFHAREQELGAQDSTDDGEHGNAEINTMRSREEMMSYWNRTMEQHEVLLVAAEINWAHYSRVSESEGREVNWSPDFDISEAAYATYADKAAARARQRNRTFGAATRTAASIDRDTRTHFAA